MTPAEGKARAARMRKLLASGLTTREVAKRYGITMQAVRRTLQSNIEPRHEPARLAWWRPDAELLRIAHAVRREIEQAEGFVRPPP